VRFLLQGFFFLYGMDYFRFAAVGGLVSSPEVQSMIQEFGSWELSVRVAAMVLSFLRLRFGVLVSALGGSASSRRCSAAAWASWRGSSCSGSSAVGSSARAACAGGVCR